MYCDESFTEIKLTDVTQCDLETKSILKPPKVRAPLQEVDLGNEITVEFDVIRKRRVSFAGVNIIKEFNSEAKSFCICNTPAYEEKVSTSSDSSAFSISASGNLNSLTKENDVTRLDDTMDLTDLSILQPCCTMNNTEMKTKKSSQVIPDIFVPKTEDSAVFQGQVPRKFFDQPVPQPRNRDENEELVLDIGPEQIFDIHKVTKPLDKPPVPDPTKILLNELLEESVADFPVDKYLKANPLFVQNKLPLKFEEDRHNIGESKYSLPYCKESSPEMSFTEAIPEAMSKNMSPVIKVQTEMQQKPSGIFQPYPNIISHNPPNSLGIYGVDVDKSKLAKEFEGNTSQMEFTEALSSYKIERLERSRVHNQNRDESVPIKGLCTSQMEFTEALPQKFSHILHHAVTKEFIDDKLSTNISNISQMEITEALPSRSIQGVTNGIKQENVCVADKLVSKRGEENQIFGTSNMEFTEALPLLTSASKQSNAISSYLDSENQVSTVLQEDPFGIGNQNLNDSCTMEISVNPDESNLLKENRSNFKETELENNHIHFESKMKNFLTCSKQVEESQEQFTGALATLKPCTNQRSLNSEVKLFEISNSAFTKLPEEIGNDILPRNISPLQEEMNEFNSMNVRELNNSRSGLINIQQEGKSKQDECIEVSKNIATSSFHSKPSNVVLINDGNSSQMEHTENLSSINIQGIDTKTIQETLDNNRNIFIKKGKSIPVSNINHVEDSSFMEFTESLVLQKQENTYSRGVSPETHDNVETKINILENTKPLENHLNESNMMDITKIDHHLNESISNHLNKNGNIDICNTKKPNVQTTCLLGQDNTRFSDENQISQMEFTEALPLRNVCSTICDKRRQDLDNENSNVAIRNSIVATNVEYYENLSLQSSHMEFTEVLPKQKLKRMSMCSKESSLRLCENILPGGNIQQNENIPPLQKSNVDDFCSMDVTEVDYPIYNDVLKNIKNNVDIDCYEYKKIMAPTACSNVIDKMYLKHSDSLNLNSLNYHSAFSSRDKNLNGGIQENSEMEFTKALPSRNIQDVNSETVERNKDSEKNAFICKRKSIMASNRNHTLDTSHMEFTEALPLLNTSFNHFISAPKNEIDKASFQSFVPRKDMLEHGFSSALEKENFNYSCSIDVTQMGNNAVNQSPLVGREFLSQNHNVDAKSYLSNDLKCKPDAHILQSESHFNEKSQMEFTESLPVQRHYSKEDNVILKSFSPTNHKYVSNDDFEHGSLICDEKVGLTSVSSVHMDFTETVDPIQPQVKRAIKQNDNIEVQGQKQSVIQSNLKLTDINSDSNTNKLSEISQMEHTEASLKFHVKTKSENAKDFSPKSCLNIVKDGFENENIFPAQILKLENTTLVKDPHIDFNEIVQSSGQLHLKGEIKQNKNNGGPVKMKSDLSLQASSGRINELHHMVSEMESAKVMSTQNSEIQGKAIDIEDVTVIQKQDNPCLTDKLVPEKDVLKANDNFEFCQSSALGKNEFDCPVQVQEEFMGACQTNVKSLAVIIGAAEKVQFDKNQEFNPLNEINEVVLKMENVFSKQILSSDDSCSKAATQVLDKMDLLSSNKDKLLKTNEQKIVTEIQPENGISFQQSLNDNSLKLVQQPPRRVIQSETNYQKNEALMAPKENYEPTRTVHIENDDNVTNDSHKKSLIHFSTPPVRNIKKRKTMGPLNPDETRLISQISSSNLTQCFNDISNADDVQNRHQKKIIEKGRMGHYPDPENGKVEWERLVKNDSFLKDYSFEFVNPYKWKYKFKWPMELFLEIPKVEVNEKTRKKCISLVSKIYESDPVSLFVDSRMKKNMSIILSDHWLNSHCKTIKDLLFTINFIEEEYKKLNPLYKSLNYFYREFPFDLISGRIIFVIVNLRQEYCFEVRIDITHAEVKGKNVDIINQVGQTSKAKVQQLFDQLPVNEERFFIFWHKLKKINELLL